MCVLRLLKNSHAVQLFSLLAIHKLRLMAAIQTQRNQSKSFYLPSALHLWDKVQRHDDMLSVS